MHYKQEMVMISGHEVLCKSNKNHNFKHLLKIKIEDSLFDFK
jgi:hypothetical protein